MKLHVLRLIPGEDLRIALQHHVQRAAIHAGFILSAVGSLSQAHLRFAGEEHGTILPGPFEILSLAGTLGVGGCHLHGAVADAHGETRGGHVLEGCTIRTTAEIVIGEAPGLALIRETDPATGYRELVVKPLSSEEKT